MEIGNIWVKIGAKIDEFEKSMSDAQRAMEKVGNKFQAVGKSLTIIGGAVIGSMGLIVKGTTALGDEFDDLSQRTGISVETLSGFKLACDKSDLSLSDFATSMKLFSRSMAEGLDKSSKAAKIFEVMNIKVDDGKGHLRDMDAVLLEVADYFSRMKNSAEKANLAVELFGRSGTGLIHFLNMSGAGLQANIDRAKELGGVWTTEGAKKADLFKESLDELNFSLQGVRNNIGNSLIPILTGLSKAVSSVIGSFARWQQQNTVLTTGISYLITTLGTVSLGLGALAIGVNTIIKAYLGLSGTLGITAGALFTTAAAFTVLGGAVLATWVITKQMTEAKKQAAEASANATIAEEGLKQKLLDAAFAAGLSSKAFKELTDKYHNNIAALAMAVKRGEEGTKLQKAFAVVCSASATAYDKQAKSTKGAGSELDRLNKLFSDGKGKAKALNEELGFTTRIELEKKLAQYKQSLAEYGRQNQLTGAAASELQQKIRAVEDELANNNATLALLGIKTAPQTQAAILFLKQSYDNLRVALENNLITQSQFNSGIAQLNDLAQKAGVGVSVYSSGVMQLGKDFDSTLPPARDLTGVLEKLNEAASDTDYFKPIAYSSKYFSAALQLLREDAGALGVTVRDDLLVQLEALKESFKRLAASKSLSLPELQVAAQKIADIYEKLGMKVPDPFAKLAPGAKKAVEETKNYFDGLFNDIAMGLGDAIEKLFSGWQTTTKDAIDFLQTQYDALYKSWRDGKISADSFYKKLEGLDKVNDAVKGLKEQYDKLYESWKSGKISSKEFYDKIAELDKEAQTLDKRIRVLPDGVKVLEKINTAFKDLCDSIKKAFFRVIGEMVAAFLIDFVKKIIGGMGILDAFLSGWGAAFKGITKGAAEATTGVGGLTAATKVSSAAFLGLATAIAAIAAVAIPAFDLLFGKWEKTEAMFKAEEKFIDNAIKNWRKLGKTWEWIRDELQRLYNLEMSFKMFVPPQAYWGTARSRKEQPPWEGGQVTEWTPYHPGRETEGGGGGAGAGRGTKWQHGFEGIVKRPIRPLIGEHGPEYVKVTPLAERSAIAPANNPINITLNLNGQIITDREYTRSRLLPEFVDALKSHVVKSEIQKALGVA